MKLLKYGSIYVLLTLVTFGGYSFLANQNSDSAAFVFLLVPFLLPFFIFFSKKERKEKTDDLAMSFMSFIVAFPVGVFIFTPLETALFHITNDAAGWTIVLAFIPYVMYLASLLLLNFILAQILKFIKPNKEVIKATSINQ